MNPEQNVVTQSLSDRLEDLQANLTPGPATFSSFFTNYHNRKNLSYAYSQLSLAQAAQKRAQQNYEQSYKQIEKRLEDLAESRPYLRKAIMGRQSEVKKGAEMAMKRSFRNQEALAASTAQRNLGGMVLSSLAKSKEQQKQQVAASTAFQMAQEKVNRRQLYNRVVNRQNQIMQQSLLSLQQMAQAQGGIGLSGLQTGLGGMLGAGAGIAGMGSAQGAWSLSQQQLRQGLQIGMMQDLTGWRAGHVGIQAQLADARRIDQAEKDAEKDTRWGAVIGAAGAGMSWLGANTGVGQRFTEWAQGGVSSAMNRIFGEVKDEKGTA